MYPLPHWLRAVSRGGLQPDPMLRAVAMRFPGILSADVADRRLTSEHRRSPHSAVGSNFKRLCAVRQFLAVNAYCDGPKPCNRRGIGNATCHRRITTGARMNLGCSANEIARFQVMNESDDVLLSKPGAAPLAGPDAAIGTEDHDWPAR